MKKDSADKDVLLNYKLFVIFLFSVLVSFVTEYILYDTMLVVLRCYADICVLSTRGGGGVKKATVA